MSESNFMQKLAGISEEMDDGMSLEQMRLYQAMITKKLEMREAEAAFFQAAHLESAADVRVSVLLRDIRMLLDDEKLRLSGSESVMLAGYSKISEGEEWLDTKRLNLLLHSFDRKPSNTTKIVDLLEKKGLMEIESEGMHAHKAFRLTRTGERMVVDLIEELKRGGRERLSVVG